MASTIVFVAIAIAVKFSCSIAIDFPGITSLCSLSTQEVAEASEFLCQAVAWVVHEQCLRGRIGAVASICPYSLSSRLMVTGDWLACLGGIRSEIDGGNGDRQVEVAWLWIAIFSFLVQPIRPTSLNG